MIAKLAKSGQFTRLLSDSSLNEYNSNGFVILKSFYSLEEYIDPLVEKIYSLFGLIIQIHRLDIPYPGYSQTNFDEVYFQILKTNRKLGGIIYDVVKQLPEFVRITSLRKNQSLAEELSGSKYIAIAGAGSGIRINNPNEVEFLADWHQEYPAQLRSPSGVVFWSPLVELTPEIGPVVVCPKSHRQGIYPVEISDDVTLPPAYRLRIHDKQRVLNAFDEIVPTMSPGDLLVMNFLTLHRSGINTSTHRALWSMQFRYFDFENEEGQKINWVGSYMSGKKFEDLYPEMIINTMRVDV